MIVTTLSAGLSILSLGLAAGLFYNFSFAVMPGLAETSDRTFVEAMRGINRRIQNPFFAVYFFGGLLFPALTAILGFTGGRATAAWFFLGATLAYLVALVITFAVNIPLNDALARAQPTEAQGAAAARSGFESRWNAWNLGRTALSLTALICATLGALNLAPLP